MKRFFSFILIVFFINISNNIYSQKDIITIQDDFDFETATDDEIAEFILHGGYYAKGKLKIGLDVPEFFGQYIDETIFSNYKTKRIVFYNCWFEHCAACVSEIPVLNEIYEKYKDKVDFIALTFMSIEDIRSAIKKHPFYFKHVSMDRTIFEKTVIKSDWGYPTSAIVVDNKIIYYKVGGIGSEKYQKITVPYFKNELDSILSNAIKDLK